MKYASQSLIHIHDLVVYYTFSSMLLYLMKHTLDVENRCILKGIKTCVTHAFAVCALTYSFFFHLFMYNNNNIMLTYVCYIYIHKTKRMKE